MARVGRPPGEPARPWWGRFRKPQPIAGMPVETPAPAPPPPVRPMDLELPVPAPSSPMPVERQSYRSTARTTPTGTFTVSSTATLVVTQSATPVRLTVIGNGPITLGLGRTPAAFGDGLVLQPGDDGVVPAGVEGWALARSGQDSSVVAALLG